MIQFFLVLIPKLNITKILILWIFQNFKSEKEFEQFQNTCG